MSEFKARTVAILGRQPEFGVSELESLYGAERIKPIGGSAALLDIEAGEINFKNLGGTIKVAKILAELSTSSWIGIEKYLIKQVPVHLKHVASGKFTLGLSAYDFNVSPNQINKTALSVKKAARRLPAGRQGSMRVVPNKAAALSSAQVLHNRLTTKGAWELVLVKHRNQTILAQTMFVQDIEAYGARDQARPARDAKVGMLPPKLAQIMINLAVGQPDPMKANGWDKAEGVRKFIVLDPFCGTGVILQEALLMGYSVYGTDIDERLVSYTKKNLQWLVGKYPNIEGRVMVEAVDATSYLWPRFSTVITEAYLGRPLNKLPAPSELNKIVQDSNTIIKKFLKNLRPQLKPDRKAVVAVPAWQISSRRFKFLPLVDELTDMGYSIVKFKHVDPGGLVYCREDQIVARQLLVIERL
ncbi:hypothetical protein A3E49_01005 [Candidatus Saccharibacteria bacterium RIFCSPHIGHO2_12_FULL_49_19]|nr:MAG: hypothetical protein A2708_01130 [Candidatus Saccharibacteria bacterium RIFCSPHIGHO2_01_FULL_49_21]OGL36861.1 MAG: hypothetical protein A3E49_01005 [Candidatus Saccharibacteria bacterium RIFCSPHIGHO2_12_FULL_49_19]OGL37092.1 MAG: hypothetical protein A3B63_01615 [Candidatus Saccharibacteria bacterium RIFCSPLOWO2_01_FULL_49_22]